jgi:hypothetical protein
VYVRLLLSCRVAWCRVWLAGWQVCTQGVATTAAAEWQRQRRRACGVHSCTSCVCDGGTRHRAQPDRCELGSYSTAAAAQLRLAGQLIEENTDYKETNEALAKLTEGLDFDVDEDATSGSTLLLRSGDKESVEVVFSPYDIVFPDEDDDVSGGA